MTNNTLLPDWMIELQSPLPGELPGEHIARTILAFEGCSVINNRTKLNALFLTNETSEQSAAQVALIQTNCGTSARCILALVGCQNKWITQPYQSGMAIVWLMQAGYDCNAIVDCRQDPNAWKQLDTGWMIHYQSPGSNNDHIEWVLTKPDPLTGIADHIGGGRASNKIGPKETGDVRHSLGRPIAQIFRPESWKLTTLPSILPIQPTLISESIIKSENDTLQNSDNNTTTTAISNSKTFTIILNWLFMMLKKLFNVK